MNTEQVKSAIRSVVIAFGGAAVGAGLITAAQLQLLVSPELWAAIGTLVSLGIGLWGQFAHKQSNAVAIVAAMPEVSKVETTSTPEGRALAADVGSTPEAMVTVAPHP